MSTTFSKKGASGRASSGLSEHCQHFRHFRKTAMSEMSVKSEMSEMSVKSEMLEMSAMSAMFEEAVDAWCRHLDLVRRQSPSTVVSYRRHVERMGRDLDFLDDDPDAPTRDIADLSAADLDEHYKRLALAKKPKRRSKEEPGFGFSPSTQRVAMAAVSSFCRYLKLVGVLEEDPSKGFDLPELYQQAPKALKKQELDRLLWIEDLPEDPLEYRDRMLLLLSFVCGLRANEIGNIHVEDLVYKTGNNARKIGFNLTIVGAKHADKDQVLPVTRDIEQALIVWLTQMRPKLIEQCPKLAGSHALIPSLKTGEGLGPDAARRIFKRRCREVDIRPRRRRLTFHILRKSAATTLLEAGCHILGVAGMLRHKSLETTKRYIDFNWEMLKAITTRYHLRPQPKLPPLWRQVQETYHLMYDTFEPGARYNFA